MDFTTIGFGRAEAHTEGDSFLGLLKNGYLCISSVADVSIHSELI